MTELLFSQNDHQYYVNDTPIPSVTQIIADLWPAKKEFIIDGSDQIGKDVHSISAGIDAGIIEGFPDDLKKYESAYKKFREEFLEDFSEIEEAHYNKNLWYAGTIDRKISKSIHGIFDGDVIIDIKTGAPVRWHRLQLAGYACLMPNPKKIIRYAIHIRPNGEYQAKRYDNPGDIDMWLKWMECYDWKHPKRPRG